MDHRDSATRRCAIPKATTWSAAALADARAETVSVVLPALNEQATVGSIVSEITHELMGHRPLVDELIVLDSGSVDATAAVARSAGARVVQRGDVLPRIPAVIGKGEAMWRAIAATSGDVVVFIDADLESFTSQHVVGLLGPLLNVSGVDFVKGAYHRPVRATTRGPLGGGRVTELVARPLLSLYWPALAHLVQPLAGEYAVRRELLEQLPFPCGYGVDFALLIDALAITGPSAFAQVDLGTRRHRHHDDLRLGRMAAEIIQVAFSRLGDDAEASTGRVIGTTITQFRRASQGFTAERHELGALERPPLREVREYADRRRPSVACQERGTESRSDR